MIPDSEQNEADRLRSFLSSRDFGGFFEAIEELRVYCFEEELTDAPLAPEVCEVLLDALEGGQLTGTPFELEGLMFLETEWARTGAPQRTRLAALMRARFPRTVDPGCLVAMAELLGRFLSDERALAILTELGAEGEDGPRSVVPYGLEMLVRHSPSKKVVDSAFRALTSLTTDPSQLVCRESSASLARIRGAKSYAGG